MRIEELAYHNTPLGELVLRRRDEPRLNDITIFEVKLGDEYLMSSLFTEAEEQLSRIALATLEGELDVVVGGLGLGYTAKAALEFENVRSLLVIDIFQEVIDWHKQGLVPLGQDLTADPRCELRRGNFFDLAKTGFDAAQPGRKFDAVLLDIDHSPKHFLDDKNRSFYRSESLEALRGQLKGGGVFALWSNDGVDDEFRQLLENVFGKADGYDIEFKNPYTGGSSVNSVYTAFNVLDV